VDLKKNWIVYLGLILLGGAIFVGGLLLGRSSGSADLAAATAKYNALRATDDQYIGSALKSVGSALAASQQLNSTGNDLETTARRIAIIANGIRDVAAILTKAESARGGSGPGASPVGPKP